MVFVNESNVHRVFFVKDVILMHGLVKLNAKAVRFKQFVAQFIQSKLATMVNISEMVESHISSRHQNAGTFGPSCWIT